MIITSITEWNNLLWVGSEQGLYFRDIDSDSLVKDDRVKGNIVKLVPARLPGDIPESLFCMTTENLYCLSADQEWKHLISNQPTMSGLCISNCSFPDCSIWIIRNDYLHGYMLGEEGLVPTNNHYNLDGQSPKCLSYDLERRTLWIGTSEGIFTAPHSPVDSKDNVETTMYCEMPAIDLAIDSSRQAVWGINNESLFLIFPEARHYNNTQLSLLGVIRTNNNSLVGNCLVLNRFYEIFICGNYGIWKLINQEQLVPCLNRDENILCVYIDRQDWIWYGSDEGLYCLEPYTRRYFDPDHGFHSQSETGNIVGEKPSDESLSTQIQNLRLRLENGLNSISAQLNQFPPVDRIDERIVRDILPYLDEISRKEEEILESIVSTYSYDDMSYQIFENILSDWQKSCSGLQNLLETQKAAGRRRQRQMNRFRSEQDEIDANLRDSINRSVEEQDQEDDAQAEDLNIGKNKNYVGGNIESFPKRLVSEYNHILSNFDNNVERQSVFKQSFPNLQRASVISSDQAKTTGRADLTFDNNGNYYCFKHEKLFLVVPKFEYGRQFLRGVFELVGEGAYSWFLRKPAIYRHLSDRLSLQEVGLIETTQ